MAATLEPAKAQRIKTISGDKVGFWCGAIDAASHRLYAGGTDFNIHAYDLPAGQPGKGGLLKGHGSYVTALAYLPASQTLISGSWDKELIWWKPARGVQPGRRVAVGARINRLAATTDGSLIAVVTDDLVARIYETETAKLRLELQGAHPATTAIGRRNTLYCVAFSPEGKRLATGDRAGTICSWDVATGKPLYRAAAKAFYSQAMSQDKLASEYEWGGVKSLAFSPDAKLLVAGGMGPADQGSAGIDGPMRLEVFDAATGKSLAAFQDASKAKGMLTTLCFLPGTDWLAAAGGGGQAGAAGIGSLWLWNYRQLDKDKKPVQPVVHKSEPVVREVLPGPDGKTLVTVGMLRDINAGRIEVWNLTGAAQPPAPLKPAKK